MVSLPHAEGAGPSLSTPTLSVVTTASILPVSSKAANPAASGTWVTAACTAAAKHWQRGEVIDADANGVVQGRCIVNIDGDQTIHTGGFEQLMQHNVC